MDTLQVSQGRDHPAIACSIDVNCVCNSSEMEEIIELYIVAGVEAGGLWGWRAGPKGWVRSMGAKWPLHKRVHPLRARRSAKRALLASVVW